ncbi:MAG: S-layer homology domain-containing protein [Oscillospiraceae bacterium]|nr:S-layer homology domain-containing protein [Oscillospiraceae bacterium]
MRKLCARLMAITIVLTIVTMAGSYIFAAHVPGQNHSDYENPSAPHNSSTNASPDALPFVDVYAHDWFFNPVVWAYEHGIMNGINATHFAPSGDMTRAMLVTVLWRYAGMPDADAPSFDDVPDGLWFSTAVAWAAENGIVHGLNETTFGLNDPITREQMYTILFRYMNFAGLTINLDEEMTILEFADEDEISSWALDALYFMFDAGVMFTHATTDNYARPREHAFRGEIAGAMFFFDKYSEPLSIIYE